MPERVSCILCERSIELSDATLGPVNAEGEISLLCNGHLWDDLKFINGLADYIADERRKFLQLNGHTLMQFGG